MTRTKRSRIAAFLGLALAIPAVISLGGCRRIFLGEDKARDRADAAAAGGAAWGVAVDSEVKRDIGELDAANARRIDFQNGGETLPIFMNQDDYAKVASTLVQKDGESYYENFFSGAVFYLYQQEIKLSGVELTIITEGGTINDPGSSVTGVYGSCGSLRINSLGFSLPSSIKFWFTRGSIINGQLEDDGQERLPLLDGASGASDRTYLVIQAFQANFSNSLLSLPVPNIVCPILVVLDPFDPGFYFSTEDTWGEMVEKMKADNKDESKTSPPAAKAGDEGLGTSGKSKAGLALGKLKGIGFSWQGIFPARRKNLWPFNADLNGVVYTNDYGERLSSYAGPEDGITFRKRNADGSYGEARAVFAYGDADLAEYGSAGDAKDDGIPIVALSNAYVKSGEIDLKKVCGIPISLEGDIGLTWANAWVPTYQAPSTLQPKAGTPAFDVADNEVYFRGMANATVKLSLGDDDKSSVLSAIFASPEIGSSTVLLNIGPHRSYAYVSTTAGGKKSLAEILKLDSLGSFSAQVKPFLDGIVVGNPGLFKQAYYFDTSYSDRGGIDSLSMMARIHGEYSFNPGCLVDSLVSKALGKPISLFPFRLDAVGDLAVGYSNVSTGTTGFFLDATVKGGFDLPFGPTFGLSAAANARLSAWILGLDDWGLRFDSNLGVHLPLGLGDFNLATAVFDFNPENIYLAGALDLDLAVGSFSLLKAGGSVAGFIQYDPFYLSLAGGLDVSLLECIDADLRASIDTKDGFKLDGNVAIPVIGSVTVSGRCNPAVPSFELKGKANILNFGLSDAVSLAGIEVAISNEGAYASGTLTVPQVLAVGVSGQIDKNGFEFKGRGDFTIAGYKLTTVDVVFSDERIALSGMLEVPGILKTAVAGEIDYESGTMTLKGTGDVRIAGYQLFSAEIEFGGSLGLDGTGPALSVRVKSRLTLEPLASIAVDGSFSASASPARVSGSLSGTAKVQAGVSMDFDVLGFGLKFGLSASASLAATVAFDISSSGFTVSVGAEGDAAVSVTFPWVKVEWKEACVDVGLFDLCVYYPDFSWTNETLSMSVHVKGAIGTDGIAASIQLGGLLDFVPAFSINLK